MSFGTLCLIGLCGFAGPLLATAGKGAVPVVVGELLAGIFLGRTGINAIDPGNPTLSFMAEIGFAMLMFAVGMNVPLRDPGMRGSLGKGATSALTRGRDRGWRRPARGADRRGRARTGCTPC